MSTFTKSDNNRCEASYRVAYHLGVAGKPYSDGKLVKRCLIDVVKCIHPGKETDYLSIALSRYSIQRRQNDIDKQLTFSLQTKVNKEASLSSHAVDESTDIKDSAQLLVFIRSLSPRFDLCENLLSMETLSSRTRGENIFIAVKNICLRNGLDSKNLRGICTDGAPAMPGNLQSFVARFSEYVSKEYGNKQLTNLRCIIHQEALCVKSVALNATFERSELHYFIHSLKCSSSPAISGTFAIKQNVCRGYFLSHRSSLAVSGRNISPCSAVAQRNNGILFHKKQKLSFTEQRLSYIFGASG